jgi:DNA repair protein RadC
MSALLRPLPPPARRRAGSGASGIATLARLGPAALADEELLGIVLGGREPVRAALAVVDPDGLSGLARAELVDLLPIGPRRAATLVAAVELGRRVATAWPAEGWRVRTPADLAERLLPAMGHLPREELRSVLLNTKNAVIGMVTVYAGNLAGSPVRVGEVFRDAVRRQAAALVVVHNHPSGDPAPSAEDLRITRELAEAGRLLDIELVDHLVIGHGRWVSLRALGVL